jgi:murein DD-endopeptidase MepM/ murein hydrolase activator NlpD
LQKPTDGTGRRPTRPRPVRREPLVSRLNRRSVAAARALQARFRGRTAASTGSLGAALAAAIRPLMTAERALPIAVAAIVAVASLLALLPSTPAGATGATQGSGVSPRLAVNGDIRYLDATDDPTALAQLDAQKAAAPQSFQPVTLPGDILNAATAQQAPADAGVVLEDGTLVTGYAPDTTVEDGSALIQMYRVRSGDTLYSISAKFNVTVKTLWWANKITSMTTLHVGQLLRIPPANGLVVTVTAADTLDSLATKYHVSQDAIMTLNQLTDPTLVVGQVLILPGAKGAPLPTPKPTPKPVVKTRTTATTTTRTRTSSSVAGRYTGGRLMWPVVGGNNYISQYYHYGHWAIDIAADYGTKVVAAAGGKVIFSGWKSNGGGWQVWISHGSNFFTTYNHMSALTVGTGEYVSRGQQVGRVGQSGDATGPHLHFETWIGPVWNGGQRMNPLNYL